jgi:hypothetical protein
MIVEPTDKGHRSEVNAERFDGARDATVRIQRVLSEDKPHGGFACVGGSGPAMLEVVVEHLGVPLAFQPYGMTEVNALADARWQAHGDKVQRIKLRERAIEEAYR